MQDAVLPPQPTAHARQYRAQPREGAAARRASRERRLGSRTAW
jgi:hypothetical protein